MNDHLLSFRRVAMHGAVVCLVFCAWTWTSAVQAQTSTWTGAVSHAPAFDGVDQLLLNTRVQASQMVGATRAIHPLAVNQGNFILPGDALTFSKPDAPLDVYGGTFTFVQPLINAGSLTKLGTGTLVLTGTDSYAGGTILSAGTLSVSSDAARGAGSGVLSLQGGTLQVTGNAFHATARPLTSDNAYSGFDVADPANMFTLGAGTLVLAGQTTLNVLAANGSIGVSPGATFDLAGFSQSAAYLAVSGTLTTGAGTLSVSNGIDGYVPGGLISGRLALTGSNVAVYTDYNNAKPGGLTITAAISGTGTLSMQDSGILVLTNSFPLTTEPGFYRVLLSQTTGSSGC